MSNQCPNCQTRPAVDHRGLCRVCVARPEVRLRFLKDLCRHRGHGLDGSTPLGGDGKPLLPMALEKWQPTEHLPGTVEKIKVMEMRARWGLPLFHPKDARHTWQGSFLVKLARVAGV